MYFFMFLHLKGQNSTSIVFKLLKCATFIHLRMLHNFFIELTLPLLFVFNFSFQLRWNEGVNFVNWKLIYRLKFHFVIQFLKTSSTRVRSYFKNKPIIQILIFFKIYIRAISLLIFIVYFPNLLHKCRFAFYTGVSLF